MVNHSLHFVDPPTNAHTYNIEGAWKPAKALLVRNMNGWGGPGAKLRRGRAEADRILQTYLDWCWWHSLNGPIRCNDPFLRILDVIAKHYPQCLGYSFMVLPISPDVLWALAPDEGGRSKNSGPGLAHTL